MQVYLVSIRYGDEERSTTFIHSVEYFMHSLISEKGLLVY